MRKHNKRKAYMLLATLLLPLTVNCQLAHKNPIQQEGKMTHQQMKSFIKHTFQEVVENPNATEATYAKYFSKDYIQNVNGERLGYKEFVQHMNTLKASVQSIKIIFEDMIVENDKICSHHVAHAIKKNGQEVLMRVIAVMHVKDYKIISCNELTFLIAGEKEDHDIGSRR
jgi:ketosteroid isomerase-like protein